MLDCLTAVPGPSTPYCREKPIASNISLTGSLLAQCRRHRPASGPAALCWGTKQIGALWGLSARVAAVRALRFIWENTRETIEANLCVLQQVGTDAFLLFRHWELRWCVLRLLPSTLIATF
ncbi:hypothetical protein TcCL_NonESM09182 [Trypanosoma cruzi]|nr:hypothetical protein TcCL_NonESM09182 [Trypanosoma cruzi]